MSRNPACDHIVGPRTCGRTACLFYAVGPPVFHDEAGPSRCEEHPLETYVLSGFREVSFDEWNILKVMTG